LYSPQYIRRRWSFLRFFRRSNYKRQRRRPMCLAIANLKRVWHDAFIYRGGVQRRSSQNPRPWSSTGSIVRTSKFIIVRRVTANNRPMDNKLLSRRRRRRRCCCCYNINERYVHTRARALAIIKKIRPLPVMSPWSVDFNTPLSWLVWRVIYSVSLFHRDEDKTEIRNKNTLPFVCYPGNVRRKISPSPSHHHQRAYRTDQWHQVHPKHCTSFRK